MFLISFTVLSVRFIFGNALGTASARNSAASLLSIFAAFITVKK
jgi:hypothetical protein